MNYLIGEELIRYLGTINKNKFNIYEIKDKIFKLSLILLNIIIKYANSIKLN